MKQQSPPNGFSLIELILVIAIIAILATIAVPSLIKAKRAAEAGNVVGTLKTLSTNQAAYMSVKGRYARIAELNEFHSNTLGTTSGRSVTRGEYRFRDFPHTNPTDASLKTSYGFRVTRVEKELIVFEVLFTNDIDGDITVIDS